jgi:hypothetical protein
LQGRAWQDPISEPPEQGRVIGSAPKSIQTVRLFQITVYAQTKATCDVNTSQACDISDLIEPPQPLPGSRSAALPDTTSRIDWPDFCSVPSPDPGRTRLAEPNRV